MQTLFLAGTSPNMVAVRGEHQKSCGPTTHWSNSQGFGPQVQVALRWKPRDGRTTSSSSIGRTHWATRSQRCINNCINDRPPEKPTGDCINDRPPEKPTGAALSTDSYCLWVAAVNHFQTEGMHCDLRCSSAVAGRSRRAAFAAGSPSHYAMETRRRKRWEGVGALDPVLCRQVEHRGPDETGQGH